MNHEYFHLPIINSDGDLNQVRSSTIWSFHFEITSYKRSIIPHLYQVYDNPKKVIFLDLGLEKRNTDPKPIKPEPTQT